MINTWSDIQLLLHAQLNSGHYKVWIAPLQAELQNINSSNNSDSAAGSSLQNANNRPSNNLSDAQNSSCTLRLYAPTKFVATRVKERYWSALTAAAAKVCGENINLELVVGRASNPLTAAEVIDTASASSTQRLE